MRNYARKMTAVRLPPERMRDLKAYCKEAWNDCEKREAVDTAAEAAMPNDRLGYWIRESVLRDLNFGAMQARGIPCSRDTFYFYRARFFMCLDTITRGGSEHGGS